MTFYLDAILKWAASQLPESQNGWIEDLRQEARHVPMGFQRFRFLSSGALAVLGELLRIKVGPRRVGQGLVGFALLGLCLSIGMAASTVDNKIVQATFYSVLPLYGLAGAFVVFNLRLMRRYTVCLSLLLGAASMILGLDRFLSMDTPIEFLRAFSFEGAFIMAGLFIAASYLSWIEEATMPERIRKVAAAAAILLGTAHLIYGGLAFKALTPEHIWFAGAGVAMICVGLANWHRAARIQAGIMTIYLIAMVLILPLPQVFVGLMIFITLALPDLNKRRV